MCSDSEKRVVDKKNEIINDILHNKEKIKPMVIGKTICYNIILNELDSEGFVIRYDKKGFVIGGNYYCDGFLQRFEVDLTEQEAVVVADYFGLPL